MLQKGRIALKLFIVRHGDPDYSIDSLTEKGWKEAAYLADRLAAVPAAAYYCSPQGRAKDTARATLEKLGRTAQECLWLREFKGALARPDREGEITLCWDWLPQDWTGEPRFFQHDRWMEPEVVAASNVPQEYRWVTENLDQLLERHGYRREGLCYRAVSGNNDTIVFFCHFGVEAVLLSHLLNISPFQLWHGLVALPTSVTTVITEERREGLAYFRVNGFGDISHLYAHGEPPAFAGRFRECWANEDERI